MNWLSITLKKRSKIGRHLHLLGKPHCAIVFLEHWINMLLGGRLKHAAKSLENSALQIEVIFLVEDLD